MGPRNHQHIGSWLLLYIALLTLHLISGDIGDELKLDLPHGRHCLRISCSSKSPKTKDQGYQSMIHCTLHTPTTKAPKTCWLSLWFLCCPPGYYGMMDTTSFESDAILPKNISFWLYIYMCIYILIMYNILTWTPVPKCCSWHIPSTFPKIGMIFQRFTPQNAYRSITKKPWSQPPDQ